MLTFPTALKTPSLLACSRTTPVGSILSLITTAAITCLFTSQTAAQTTPPVSNAVNDEHPIQSTSVDRRRLPVTIAELYDDWFWPDPYSSLGHVRANGEGWEICRVAADPRAAREMGITDQQVESFKELYQVTTRQTPKGNLSERQRLWHSVANKIKQSLNDKQYQRLRQIVLQRNGYNAFLETQTKELLAVSDRQSEQINDAIRSHQHRIASNLKNEKRFLAALPDKKRNNRDRVDSAPEIRRDRIRMGWLSHQKVWNDVREIFDDGQVDTFQKLRGPKAGTPVVSSFALKEEARPTHLRSNQSGTPSDGTPPPLNARQLRLRSKLRRHLNRDLSLHENNAPSSLIAAVYGNGTLDDRHPSMLAQSMVPPAYRVFMERLPKLHQLEFGFHSPPLLSDSTEKWVTAHLDDSLMIAITLLSTEDPMTARMAAEVIRRHRSDLSVSHWNLLVNQIQFQPSIRSEYPQSIESNIWGISAIPFGFLFLPGATEIDLVGSISGTLDEQPPVVQPLSDWRSNLPTLSTEKLSEGPHKISYTLHYQLTKGDSDIHGTVESVHPFTVVSTYPDKLIADETIERDNKIRKGIQALPIKSGRRRTYSKQTDDGSFSPIAELVIPYLQIAPLPVDLAMKVHVQFETSDKPHSRPDIVLPKGMTSRYEVEGMIGDGNLLDVLRREADSRGMVSAKVVLTPSRSIALSHAAIENYYGKTIQIPVQFRLISGAP